MSRALLIVLSACAASGCSQVAPRPSPQTSLDQADAAPSVDNPVLFDPATLGIERVIIIGIDGLGGQFRDGEHSPNLEVLAQSGTEAKEMQSAVPTLSSPNWMSLINGTSPAQHGVLDNGWQLGDSVPSATIFAVVREHLPQASIAVIAEWDGFLRLVESGAADILTDAEGPEHAIAEATELVRSETPPTLLFVHLDNVDHAGHEFGWGGTVGAAGSTEYFDALALADRLVAQLVDEVDRSAIADETLILVVSDHGGNDLKGHGGDTKQERDAYLLMLGHGVARHQIAREVRPWDVPATVAAVLGLPVPGDWFGRPLLEGLNGWPGYEQSPPTVAVQPATAWHSIVNRDDIGAKAVAIWRPEGPAGYAPLGHVVTAGGQPGCTALLVAEASLATTHPLGYERIAPLKTYADAETSTLWSPVPPAGFVCLGDVASAGTAEPATSEIACIREDLVVAAPPTKAWSDASPVWEKPMTLYSPSSESGQCVGFVTRATALSDSGYAKYFVLDEARLQSAIGGS